MRRRVQDAFRTRATESPHPHKRMEEENLLGGDRFDGAIDLLFGRRHVHGMELTELVDGNKLVKMRAELFYALVPCRQQPANEDYDHAQRQNQKPSAPSANRQKAQGPQQ